MTRWTELTAETGTVRIDPDGRISPAPELAPDLDAGEWLRDRIDDPPHWLYAIGGVAMAFDAQTILVRHDVRAITDKARDALLDLLAGERRDRAVLSCHRFGAWAVDAAPTARAAIEFHERLAALAPARPLMQTTLRRIEVDAGATESPHIAALLNDWRKLGRRSPPGCMPAFVDTLPGGIVVSMDDDGSDMYVAHVGARSAAAVQYGSGWQTEVLGQRVVAPVVTPNHEIRVCQVYPSVTAEGAPYFDHVLGCLDHTPAHHVWVRYRRLILPFEMDNGTPALFVYIEKSRDVFSDFMKPA